MAMTFTLVTHLRERLSVLMREREERIRREEMEKERRALEVRAFFVIRHRAHVRLHMFLGGGSQDSGYSCHRRVLQGMED